MRMTLFKRPFPVFFLWGGIWMSLFLLGAVMSRGWICPDASPYRDFLYIDIFVLLPASGCLGLIHFLSCIITPIIATRSTVIAFFSGFIGIGILNYAIRSSPDPEAAMAYIATIIFYAIFAVAGFVVSTIGLWIWHKKKNC